MVGDIAPYVGLGYAKVKGNWHKSYYRGTPGPDANYGMKGKTKVNGRYISAKVGINFKSHPNKGQ
jgi:hypothetical protein